MKDSKLNIAIFTPSQNPYSETFIQAHKNYLKGNVFYYYGNPNNIKLEGKSDLVSNRKRKVLKLEKLSFRKSKKFINKKRIEVSLNKNQIEVILIEYANHARRLLPMLKDTKLPVIVHFHGMDASLYQFIEKENYYKEVFQYANKIIVVSKIMRQMVLELGCPKEKIVYNVYGPQPEFEKVAPTFSKKQFLAVGRFTDKKAPYYTILAFKEVLKSHPDAKLLMAGDGALYNMSKNLIRFYNLEENIKLLGVISPKQYRTFLEESLAFVQHSIRAENGDMEGTPLAILEASLAGLPVVSTNHAGIPDVIVNGVTGLLSNEHDVEAMVTNMLMLLNDIQLVKKMGKAGKKNIKENFNLERHIASLHQVINEIVQKTN